LTRLSAKDNLVARLLYTHSVCMSPGPAGVQDSVRHVSLM